MAFHTDHAEAVAPEGFDLEANVLDRQPAALPLSPRLGFRRGRGDARAHAVDLADYFEAEAEAPKAVHRSHLEHTWPMFLNDQLGDCGPAMVLHGNEAMHLDARTPVPPWSDKDGEVLDEHAGGYVPGDPETDQGVENPKLIKCCEKGVTCAADKSVHKYAATAWVDPRKVALNQLAIWEFVVLYLAVALPITAQGQRTWEVTDKSLRGEAEPGSWGGHDIPFLSYDGARYRNVTWGTELLVTYEFDRDYAEEGFVAITQEMLSNTGVSPAGFNWTKLAKDLPGV